MNRLIVSSLISTCTLTLLVLAMFPLITHAQSGSDIRAVIRSSLLTDPRSASLSQSDLNAMVELLAKESERKGLTVEDMVPHQAAPAAFTATASSEMSADDACTSWPPLCTFNSAFGFDDQNSAVPLLLLITSLGMVWILAEVIHMRSRRT